jgi:hypothetical protein
MRPEELELLEVLGSLIEDPNSPSRLLWEALVKAGPGNPINAWAVIANCPSKSKFPRGSERNRVSGAAGGIHSALKRHNSIFEIHQLDDMRVVLIRRGDQIPLSAELESLLDEVAQYDESLAIRIRDAVNAYRR